MNNFKSPKNNTLLGNSYFSEYQNDSNYINDSSYFDSSYNNTDIRKVKYYDIQKQVKEEIKKNNINKKTKNKTNKKRNQIDDLYLKSTNQMNKYLKDNYSNIEISGTKELEGINKKDLENEVKQNQLHWTKMSPGLKYRSPELNKNCEKLNYTPIPYNSHINEMNNYQKKEYDKAIKNAVYIRKVEYTHAHPSLSPEEEERKKNKKEKYLKNKLLKEDNAKIIQRWYRYIKNNKIRKENKKILLKNKNNYKSNEETDIYKYWEEQNKSDKEQLINSYKKNKMNKYKIKNEDSFNLKGDKSKNFDSDRIKYDKSVKFKILGKPKKITFLLENNDSFNYLGNSNSHKQHQFSNELYPEKENSFKIIDFKSNKLQFSSELIGEKEISFKIIDHKKKKYLYKYIDNNNDNIIILKPIKKCCYITKEQLILLNKTDDMKKIKFIQNQTKCFLRYKNTKNNNINNINNYNLKVNNSNSNNSLNSNCSENHNDIKNNSKNQSYIKRRMISELDSLKFFHNLTINKDTAVLFENILKNNQEFLNNKQSMKYLKNTKLNNDSKINSYNSNISLSLSISDNDNTGLNFNNNNENYLDNKMKIFDSQDNQCEFKKIIKIQTNQNSFFEKIRYKNLEQLFLTIKDLQSKIISFLHRKQCKSEYRESCTYSSSSSNYNNSMHNRNIKFRNKKINRSLKIDNFNFNLSTAKKKSDKLQLLKKLVNKNNRILNEELNHNVNSYYDNKNKMNQLLNITKKKLPIKIVKIIKDKLKPIFNDIYQYNSIENKRKKILLKLFNNTISRLKYYFYKWSGLPLNLLIYKSKNNRYYHSLYILNNKIKILLHTISKVYIKKYFILLVIRYLYMCNIDINNIEILYFLNKGFNNFNIINDIFKYYHGKDHNNNENKINSKIKLINYLNILEKLDTNDNIDIIQNEEYNV